MWRTACLHEHLLLQFSDASVDAFGYALLYALACWPTISLAPFMLLFSS